MPVEPGIIDTNVLVYALDADAPQHGPSRALLEAARDGSATLYVTLQILCEFYSAVTNPRRVPKPRSPAEALAAISKLRVFLPILPVPAHTADELESLLRRHPVAGGRHFRFADCRHHKGQRPAPNLHIQQPGLCPFPGN
jgi:predicted nucleic acid-binding protein